MRIFIDIGHPAHVHYFKNFYFEMINRGHEILISARDKECSQELLDHYKIPYKSRGKGKQSYLGKFIYLVKADYLIYKYAREFDPDLFLSFCSPYAAQVSSLLRKPHIAFDDTEHAKLAHLMFVPFTEAICTPYSFSKNLGHKQVRFDGFMESCALHPNRFEPDPSILNRLSVEDGEKYVILRFVSWGASHDLGEQGIPDGRKVELVRELSNYAKVFISSEGKLPDELLPYQLDLPADKIHDALYYAALVIGEGATMAAESALLGTPTVYINSQITGYLSTLEKKGLLQSFRKYSGVQKKASEMLKTEGIKQETREKAHRFLKQKIDVTAFMVRFIENYPRSLSHSESKHLAPKRFSKSLSREVG